MDRAAKTLQWPSNNGSSRLARSLLWISADPVQSQLRAAACARAVSALAELGLIASALS